MLFDGGLSEGAVVIVIEELRVRFRDRTVLDGISLDIADGEVVVLVGANGSGKTTLFRAIAGAVLPSAGTIHVDGSPQIVGGTVVPVSYVSDRRIVWNRRTPRQVLRTFASIHGMPRRIAKERVRSVVERLSMADYADKWQDKLSTGQAAKFAIARMLLHPYRAVLLDEPTAGLDFNASAIVQSEIRTLAAAGHSVFVTSHRLDEIMSIADRILVLADGLIVLDVLRSDFEGRSAELPQLIGNAT
jgi:ABC-type multidrug transport system ATPase subunit